MLAEVKGDSLISDFGSALASFYLLIFVTELYRKLYAAEGLFGLYIMLQCMYYEFLLVQRC